YELLLRQARARALLSFGWRAGIASLVACAWWAIPAVLQSRYGGDFLSYTEQPSAIWATPSMSESLRLLGFWLMYIAVGSEPVMSIAPTYLFSLAVIVAGFLVPLIAFGCLRWTRRWEYGPFFGLLACAALVFMALGFPDGAPMREAMEQVYASFEPVRFLRTTYKAAPLVALGLACLGGAGFAALLRLFWAVRGHPRGVRLPAWAPGVALAIPALFALPLLQGRAIDPGRAYDQVPRQWYDAVAAAERTTPEDHRLMILPGSLFAWYRFGETVTSVAPALSERPVLVREVTRYADQRASELQTYVDDLVQQGRLVPGQLDPLLRLMGVGQLLLAADQRVPQSGSLEPARVEQALAGQDLGNVLGTYGEMRRYMPNPGWSGQAAALPDLRRVEGPGASGPGIVRVHRQERPVVLDGDGEGVTELAAAGRLDPERALFYAGDLDRTELARLVDEGARIVITDSNRWRPVDPNRMRENRAWTLGGGHPIPLDWPPFGLFAGRGTAGRTVATYSGLDWLRGPLDRRFAIYPQYRPYAALDGDYETAWLAGAGVESKNSYFELKLSRPRPIGSLRVLPHQDAIAQTRLVAISVNGGPERGFPVESGWNDLPLGEPEVSTLKLRVRGAGGGFAEVNGGLTELDIPGLRVRESLRTPLVAAREARGLDLSPSPLLVLLQRTTADFPYRAGKIAGDPQAGDPLDMVDAEPGIERTIELPATRRFRLGGWASARPDADPAIDRLLGMPRGWRFSSSSRFEGVPGSRALSAFDGDPSTAWIGDWSSQRQGWIEWRSPRPVSVRHLLLLPGPGVHPSPAAIELMAKGRRYGPVPVERDGHVRLPRRVRARRVVIRVVALRPPREPAQPLRSVAIGELWVPNLDAPLARRTGAFASDCGELTVAGGGTRATARVTGTVA
ncbi:MAG: alpha-(1-_3)-arabinofuranosyltransferase domain-containing protein, partial [Thermoleophilaceae bacterium]